MSDETVKVTVFGPGYGESIVLNIPGVGWGVIDSCLTFRNKQKINPALEYLTENKVQELAFIILTHPHEDHFLGIDLIIEQFLGRIKKIFYYNGAGIREYRTYLSKKAVLHGGGDLRNLAKVYKSFEQARDKGAEIYVVSEQTPIVQNVNHNNHEINVVALSPSAESIKRYTEIFFQAIPVDDGDTFNFLSDQHHNLLSIVVWCEIGNIRLLLGSDIENGDEHTGWQRILASSTCPNLASHFVKVSHHGSAGAFYKPAWDKFNHQTNPIAVITPYNRSPLLPQESMMRQIAKHSHRVFITSQTKYLKAQKVYDKTVVDNMLGVKDWNVIIEPDATGYISVDLSPASGAVVRTTLVPPAFLFEAAATSK